MGASFKKLDPGTRIRARLGELSVQELLGGGSQGDVYAVTYNGDRKALKWYRNDAFLDRESFMRNLQRNATNGSPSGDFLWPLDVTEVQEDGCFGYVMDLRPQEFVQADDVLIHPDLFPSYRRIIDVCLNIAHAFRKLHQAGYVYRDISAGNFFVNPQTGRVLICDNDNVAPPGVDTGIRGTPRFMAPEIVVNNTAPTEKSDRHSLSVIIFYLMLMQHPLEGMRADMLDAETQKLIYGTDPLFIFDTEDRSNAPVPGASGALELWNALPQHMRDMFARAFSRDALMNPSHRPAEINWIRELVRLRSEVVTCPACGSTDVFLQDAMSQPCDNPSCHAAVRVPLRLELSLMGYSLPLVDDMRVYACQTSIVCDAARALDPVAWALPAGERGAGHCIRNISTTPWKARFQGKDYDVNPGQAIAVLPGIELQFGDETARIVENDMP